MSLNTQHDSRILNNLFLPYDRTTSETSTDPRIVRGLNSLVNIGGKIIKRPGTLFNTYETNRMDRLWEYETLGQSPKHFLLGSFYNGSTWQMMYRRTNGLTTFSTMGSYRALDASTRPHELVVQNGLAYIKSFPSGASAEKLGTVIFDASGGSPVVYPWGILGPTTPARIVAQVAHTNAAVTLTQTTITVAANFTSMPATPFIIFVIYPGQSEEYMIVTGVVGTTWTVTRSATPAAHPFGAQVFYRNWTTSDHAVDVKVGWAYTYAYKSITGQVSNRAPLETNVDLAPSNTFPFFDKRPQVTIQGNADMTNITKIVVYRTQDGGGVYCKLEEITNTGAGAIVYEDKSLGTGASSTTFHDPLPDSVLDEANRSATLESNGPPITVVAPKVVGTDTPDVSSNIESYAGRLLYGIGNVLLFSSSEGEITTGIGEESWPVGAGGNSEKVQTTITGCRTGTNGCYIFTSKQTYKLTGTTKETFSLRPIYDNMGGLLNNPRSSVRAGNKVAFVANDYRIIMIDENDNPIVLSDPLGSDIVDAMTPVNREIELTYWADKEKEWLVVEVKSNSDTSKTRQWIFDIRLSDKLQKPFWNTPWTIKSTCVYSGRLTEDSQQRYLCFFIYTGVAGSLSRLLPDGSITTDTIGDGIPFLGLPHTTYQFVIDTNLFRVPLGNHVNELRDPDLTPVFKKLIIERNILGGEPDPDVYFYFDDFWTEPVAAHRDEVNTVRFPSKGYKTMIFYPDRVAFRVGLSIVSETAEPLTLYSMTMTWNPDEGA